MTTKERRRRRQESQKHSHYRGAGRRMRLLRAVLCITEKQAADAYGVTLATYRRYEAGGSQRGWRFMRFAKKYEISSDYLICGVSANVGPHLSKRAPGKVAILPVSSPETRRALQIWLQSQQRGEPLPA